MHFADKLSVLCSEFTWHFNDFEEQKMTFELLLNPFAVDVKSAAAVSDGADGTSVF